MNSSEMFNREKKAARLAAVLFECGATSEDVLTATPPMWEVCAHAATQKLWKDTGVKETVYPPHSQATVYAVVEHLNRLYLDGAAEPKSAQQEADEAAAADEKAEGEWLDKQMLETGNERTPRI